MIVMNRYIYDSFRKGVRVCQHNNMKTIAAICFLLGSYVDWRKIFNGYACQGHRSMSRSFLEGLKSLGKVVSYSVIGGEIQSPMWFAEYL